jgi:tetratricopeptide (TPR) repeat protein
MLWSSCLSLVRAEEPYEKFLDKLRQERLFDLALVYLTELESTPGVSSKFKSDAELERGMLLYQSAALLSVRSPLRGERLDSAEAALRQFLQQNRDHPRRGEARLRLGELLLTRADEAREQTKSAATPGADATDTPTSAPESVEAIKFYDEAHQLFEGTIAELAGILEQLRGNRVDPSDTEKVAFRERIQNELRQSQLLSAKSVEERGRSRSANNPEWQKDLEQALKMYSDLYSKEQKNLGIRNYSLFYRSTIHASLGKTDDAIDGFQRIVDAPAEDLLRPLQTDAIAELLPLLADQGKYEPAFDRADKWLKGIRVNERNRAETINLQMAFAKFRIGWVDKLKEAGTDERLAPRLTRDTRSDLRSLLRTPGPHLDEARGVVGEFGG